MAKSGEQALEVMSRARWYNNWLFSIIKPKLRGEILEVGSGIGNFTGLLSKESNITAIDLEKKYIKKLKSKFKKAVDIGFGDIEKGKYFFKDKKFDTVVAINVLEHIKDDFLALDNIYKLLNKGGKLIIIVPAHMFLYSNFDENIGHFRRYSLASLRNHLNNSGFSIRTLKYLNIWSAVGWFLWMKLLRNKKMPNSPVLIFDRLGRLLLFFERYLNPPFGISVYAVAEK